MPSGMRAWTPVCLALPLLILVAPAAAQTGCSGVVENFRAVIGGDAQSGNLNQSVYRRMMPELDRVTAICRSGHDGEALRALQTLKSRYGYH